MTDHRHTGGSDDALRALLRDVYAPPAGPEYWAALESRVLAHVRQGTAETLEWWQLLGAWARAGAVAAGVVALAAGAALLQARAADARAAFEAVVEATPTLPLTAVARRENTPTDGREATLRYVISH
jgi:anti-sigma-K factor RskA